MPHKNNPQQDKNNTVLVKDYDVVNMRSASSAFEFKEALKKWLNKSMKPPVDESVYIKGNHPAELAAYRQGWNHLAHIILRDALTDKEVKYE